MLVHHLFAHLLRVRAHVRETGVGVRHRELDAAPENAVDAADHIRRKLAAGDDPAERNRKPGLLLPVLAEVEDLVQALRRVGKAVLVDDHARVGGAGQHGAFDVGEDHLRLVRGRRKREPEEEVRGRVLAGNRNRELTRRDLFDVDLAFRDEQRAAVPSERASRVQGHVAIGAERERMVAELRDVQPAGKCRAIQRFDVVEADVELQSLEVDAPVHDRVEDEAIVRAR